MRVWFHLFGALLLTSGCAMAAKPVAPWDSFRVGNAYAIFADKAVADLAVAGAKGDTKAIDRLLAQGVNINTVGEFGETPLFWALYAHNKTGFQKLLERGADPNAKDENGDGVIHLAAEDEDPDYLRLALANRGDPNLRDKRGVFPTPIYRAIHPNQNDNLKILLTNGADKEARDVSKKTPLQTMVFLSQFNKAYILLMAGADYQATDGTGHTVADYIARFPFSRSTDPEGWRDKVIAFLREHGMEVRPRNP